MMEAEKVVREVNALPAPVTEVGMTSAETLRQRGVEEGLDKGKLLGLDKGQVLEARKALGQVLQARGLEVGASHDASIDGCSDLATLERWLRAAVTTPSIDDTLRLAGAGLPPRRG